MQNATANAHMIVRLTGFLTTSSYRKLSAHWSPTLHGNKTTCCTTSYADETRTIQIMIVSSFQQMLVDNKLSHNISKPFTRTNENDILQPVESYGTVILSFNK